MNDIPSFTSPVFPTRENLLKADAEARQKGVNLDGSPRRETVPEAPPRDRIGAALGAKESAPRDSATTWDSAAGKPVVRIFATGANRDLDADKLDFEAFLSPTVIQAFGEYMHRKRRLADGSLRDGDNWQKGIPLDAYMKSGWRHLKDWWAHHRGHPELTVEDLEDTLCALLFNVQGYLHEVLKAKAAASKNG